MTYVKMGIFNVFLSVLSYFGLSRPKRAKLLFLGLGNAGKSTLLLNLAHGRSGSVAPTVHPGSEELIIGNVVFTTFGFGGPQQVRQLWEEYIHDSNTTAVVFVVDAQDPGRFDEAAAKLHALLAIEELAGAPFLVLGNKVDHPEAGHGMLNLLSPWSQSRSIPSLR
jgi:GTP-binding protein SAR1